MNPNQTPQQQIGMVEVDGTKVDKKEFFSRLDGCTYYFKNGSCARFEGGSYITDKKGEVEELNALLKVPGQHLIIDHPVELPAKEGIVMKEVGSSKGPAGIVNTGHLLAAMTGRK